MTQILLFSKVDIKKIEKRNNDIIDDFTRKFSNELLPIEVDFRKIIPEIKSAERLSHLIHSYPAKLLVHIPYFFLNNTKFSQKGDWILDPFCGSGTVLLESLIAEKNSLGVDANPLARLISEVKVTRYNENDLTSTLNEMITAIERVPENKINPDVVNCDYWFSKNIQSQLSSILYQINNIEDESIRKFMTVSFSNCVKKVSYADPRISVPVKLNPDRYDSKSLQYQKVLEKLNVLENYNVLDKFYQIANDNINRIKSFNSKKNNMTSAVISEDSRDLSKIKDNSIQLIITSPPYAGAQKYIRASSLNIGWTQLARVNELVILDRKNIGRESYSKKECFIEKTGIEDADLLIEKISKIKLERAVIVNNYLIEMQKSLKEMIRVLKTDGYLVLVVGNNMVCNFEFNTQEYLTQYILSKGLQLQFKLIDDIKSYGLMTRRNKTADIISREWILVFKK